VAATSPPAPTLADARSHARRTVASSSDAGRTERRIGIVLLLLCLAAYGYFIPRGPSHNADSRLALTYSLVERGLLSIDDYAAVTLDRALRAGHYYTDKAPGVSLALAPLYAMLRLLPLPDVTAGGDRFITRYLLTFLGIGLPAAAFSTWLFHWLRRFCACPWPRFAVVLGYALGSPAYPFSTAALGHVPAGMCLFGAFALAQSSHVATHRRLTAVGLLLGCAVAFEYPAALPAAAVGAFALGASRAGAHQDRFSWTRPGRVVLGTAPPLLLVALYHTAAFGAPWLTGYAFLDPSSPYAEAHRSGLLGIGLPSPLIARELVAGASRGLLVHAPWLVLALPGAVHLWRSRSCTRAAAVCLAATGLLLTINSGYAVWHGGASWGPRHLVPALPFLTLLALPAAARYRRLAATLVALSIAPTVAVVATGSLPPESGTVPLLDYLWPAMREGRVTNSWGLLLGLANWRTLVPLALVPLALGVYLFGWRAAGWLAPAAWALVVASRLDRAYLDYAEGYYLYLGARVAQGAVLYRDAAATQPPVLPLIVSALWSAAPGVYLPRLLALACYVATAVLAGALAVRLTRRTAAGPLACLVAAALPLGASQPQVLETNALLAPLGPAVALLATGSARQLNLGGLLSGLALGVKLTFAPLALAPVLVLLAVSKGPLSSRLAAAMPYAVGLLLASGALFIGTYLWAGPAAMDAWFGELESPLLLAGAALSVFSFLQLEGGVAIIAATGWWHLRRAEAPPVPLAMFAAAALLPLLAIHQGTFVSVARPAEPFLAAFAAAGILWLVDAATPHLLAISPLRTGEGLGVRSGLLASTVLVGSVAIPLHHTLSTTADRHAAPDRAIQWTQEAVGPGVVSPPYYAALAGRTLRHDYADWTVLGMRAAAAVEPEAGYARSLVADLDAARIPSVLADFRLFYIPGVRDALDRSYAPVGSAPSSPDRSATLYRPRERSRGPQ
jgi:hypothetical protein